MSGATKLSYEPLNDPTIPDSAKSQIEIWMEKEGMGANLVFSKVSTEYIEWLGVAAGKVLYAYLDTVDNQEAKNRKNVTLGIGFTFDNTGGNWDKLRDILGWTDSEIKTIIQGFYSGKTFSKSTYTISEQQAYDLFYSIEDKYKTDLNKVISVFNEQNGHKTSYTQKELEAMFDYSYNNGLSPNKDGIIPAINDPNQIIYYYLRKDQQGAVKAMKQFGGGNRRRLNQANLFFNESYDFVDSAKPQDLEKLRRGLGF